MHVKHLRQKQICISSKLARSPIRDVKSPRRDTENSALDYKFFLVSFFSLKLNLEAQNLSLRSGLEFIGVRH